MIISTSDCLSAEFRNPRGFLSLKANELSRLGGGGGERGGRERNEEGSIKGSGVGNRKSIVPLPLKGMRIILCIV